MRKRSHEHARSQSRKWRLVLLVVILATMGAFLPPLVSAWIFNAAVPLTILSGTEYVSILTLVVSAYFGANVFQKHIEFKNGATPVGYGTEPEPDPSVNSSITKVESIRGITQEEDDSGKEA